MIKLSNPLSFETTLRLFHVFNHAIAIYVLWLGEYLWFLWAYGAWFIIGGLGVSGGFHRLLSHRSYNPPMWYRNFVIVAGSLATGGSPVQWPGAHREHHKSPDQPGDPHAASVIGYLRVYFHVWGHVKIRRRFISDLIKDPLIMFIHRNYFPILVAYAGFLFALGGFGALAIGYSIPAVYAFHGYGAINTIGHSIGYRNYDTNDLSRNHWIVQVLTFEGWHNNHHHRPSSYQIGHKWWEIDPVARVISWVDQK